MFSFALVAAACCLLYKDKLQALLASMRTKAGDVQSHHYIAGGCLALAAVVWWADRSNSEPPDPQPKPAPRLDLRGKFRGDTAYADAISVSALCGELARELEWDGTQETPMIRSGVQFDELRIRARQLLCGGESIGDRQPEVRAEIEEWLNTHAGTSGGPLSPEARARWVAAYRDVAEAAEAATR